MESPFLRSHGRERRGERGGRKERRMTLHPPPIASQIRKSASISPSAEYKISISKKGIFSSKMYGKLQQQRSFDFSAEARCVISSTLSSPTPSQPVYVLYGAALIRSVPTATTAREREKEAFISLRKEGFFATSDPPFPYVRNRIFFASLFFLFFLVRPGN